MKKLLNIGFSALLFGFALVSCNDDDYQTIESIDKVKIDSVKITNDTMDIFAIQHIKTYSAYSSQCQGFYAYDYVYDGGFKRTVTAYKYISNGPCAQKSYSAVNQISFNPQRIGKYTFTFWNGGNNWITKTIVVK